MRRDPRSFPAFFSLGALLSKEGRYEEAVKFLEQARALNPRHSDTLYELGRAYQKTGGLDKACEDARAATQADPKNRPAHYLLAQIARQRGDEQPAQREFHIAPITHKDINKVVPQLATIRVQVLGKILCFCHSSCHGLTVAVRPSRGELRLSGRPISPGRPLQS